MNNTLEKIQIRYLRINSKRPKMNSLNLGRIWIMNENNYRLKSMKARTKCKKMTSKCWKYKKIMKLQSAESQNMRESTRILRKILMSIKSELLLNF